MRNSLALLFAGVLTAGHSFELEPNQGQFAPEVRFAARLRHGSVQWTDRETVFTRDNVAVRVELVGARTAASWQPGDAQPGTTDYLLGRRKEDWIRQVPRYASLERKQVYDGIDWIAYAAGGTMEYDFVVAPGADPASIRMRFAGARDVRVRPNGDLEVVTDAGPLVQHRPVLYQLAAGKREPVEGRFAIAGDMVGFATGAYDRSRTLWIDPVLESATFWGGSAEDEVVFVSPEGFVVGTTTSVDLPNSVGRRRGRDVFVVLPGSTMVIGGSGDDVATAATYSAFGQTPTFQIVGYTDSRDLPTTTGVGDFQRGVTEGFAIQPEYAGGTTDGFVITVRRANPQQFLGAPPFLPFFVSYFGTPGEDRVQGLWNFVNGGNTVGLAGYSDAPGLPGRLGGQTAPKGGKDAFFSLLDISVGVANTTYVGGSGDDEARAVQLSGQYWLAGETRSPDFPGATGLKGESDAFLVTLRATSPQVGTAELDRARVFGGAGPDRINALAVPLTSLGLYTAGVTGSPDFPQTAGAAYGGGASDAFLQRWTSLTAEGPEWSSLLGGEGTDEALALSNNEFGGTLAVAGRTNSRSLPVRDAWQAAYGGGDWDGWLARFHAPAMTLNLLTYFGGPGADQIQSVNDGDALVFGGVTTAAGWPDAATVFTTYQGGADGFAARLTHQIFAVQSPQLLPQDLVRGIRVGLGGTTRSQPVRVRSSDPSRLLISTAAGDEGQSEVTVTSSAGAITIFVHALASSGSADLLLAADGFAPASVLFGFEPQALRLQAGSQTNRYGFSAQVPSVTLSIASTGFFSDTLRPGATPVRVRLTSTQPSVFLPSVEEVVIPGQFSLGQSIGLQQTGIGEAELVATAVDREMAPARLPVMIVSPFAPSLAGQALRIATGTQLVYTLFAGRTPARFRVTSSNPALLVVSGSAAERGRESLEFSTSVGTNQGVFLQALGETGELTLQVQVNDGLPESIPVRIVPPVLRLQANVSRGNFGFGATADQVVRAESGSQLSFFATLSGNSALLRTPGFAPIVIPLVSSNPEVAQPQPTQVEIGTSANFVSRVLTLRQTGTATIRALPPTGIEMEPGFESMSIQVDEARFAVRDFELGNGLLADVRIPLPPAFRNPGTSFVAESSNPDLVDLSSTGGFQFAGRVTVSNNQGGGTITMLARGKQDQGEATITFSASNGTTGQARVTLRPGGFVWELGELQVPLHSSSDFNFGSAVRIEPRVRAMVLDPGTRLPIAEQRAINTVRIPVTSANPAVGELATPTVPAAIVSSAGGGAFFVPKSLGETTLTMGAPDGFVQPATGQTLRVRVTPGAITNVPETLLLGRDLQVLYSFTLPYARDANEEVTLTSSDGSRVLISDSPTRPGVPSLRIRRDSVGAYPGVYLQALAAEGSATVTIQGAGLRDAVTTVNLRPFVVRLLPANVSSNQFRTTAAGLELIAGRDPVPMRATLDTDRRLGPGEFPAEHRLRPGAPALDVDLISLQPEIAAPTEARLRFSAGESAKDFTLRPTGVGDLELRANTNNTTIGSLRLRVRRAGFAPNVLAIGRDQQMPLVAQFAQDTPRPNGPLTVRYRSLDPARLLLSNSTQSLGTAEADGPAEQNGVIMQALAEGEATVMLSADGYADTPVRVHVLPPAVSFAQDPRRQTVNLQQGSLPVTIRLSAISESPSTQFSLLGGGRRAGLPPLPIIVRSLNPAVAGDVTGLLAPGVEGVLTLNVPLTGQGQAKLEVTAADHGVTGASTFDIDVLSERPQIFGVTTLGRDFVAGLSVRTNTPLAAGRAVTITSSDPTRLTVSASPDQPGQGSVRLPAGRTDWAAHALGDSGTVTITIQIDSYQEVTHRITLRPSGPAFNQERVTLRTDGVPGSLEVAIRELDPVTLQPSGQGQIRPGVTYVVGLRLADPAVASLTASSLTFTYADSSGQRAALRGLTPGSTLLRVTGPAGSSVASTGATVLVSVDAAPVEAPAPMLLGRDQQSSFRFRLAQPSATGAVFNVSTSDASRLVLSRNPTQLGTSSLNVTVAAGQRESELLYVQSIGANPPAGTLVVTGTSSALGSWSMPVTVRNALVIFRPPPVQPVVVRRGGNTVSLTVINSVEAQPGDPAPGALYFRPGTPLFISVSSTNSAVLAIGTITSRTLTQSPADPNPEVFLIPVAVGTARVDLMNGAAATGAGGRVEVRVE